MQCTSGHKQPSPDVSVYTSRSIKQQVPFYLFISIFSSPSNWNHCYHSTKTLHTTWCLLLSFCHPTTNPECERDAGLLFGFNEPSQGRATGSSSAPTTTSTTVVVLVASPIRRTTLRSLYRFLVCFVTCLVWSTTTCGRTTDRSFGRDDRRRDGTTADRGVWGTTRGWVFHRVERMISLGVVGENV